MSGRPWDRLQGSRGVRGRGGEGLGCGGEGQGCGGEGRGQIQGDDAPAVAPVRRGRGRPQGGRGHGNVAAAEIMILEILEKAMSAQTLMMFVTKVMRNTIYQCNSVEIVWWRTCLQPWTLPTTTGKYLLHFSELGEFWFIATILDTLITHHQKLHQIFTFYILKVSASSGEGGGNSNNPEGEQGQWREENCLGKSAASRSDQKKNKDDWSWWRIEEEFVGEE